MDTDYRIDDADVIYAEARTALTRRLRAATSHATRETTG